MADVNTRIGAKVDEKSVEQWPVEKIRLAGSEDKVKKNFGVERTVVPWVTAFPTYADNSPNKGK
jgi:hypothetical protein